MQPQGEAGEEGRKFESPDVGPEESEEPDDEGGQDRDTESGPEGHPDLT